MGLYIWWKDGNHRNCALENLELLSGADHMARTTVHKVSPKHLARYVNEFTFRLNEGNVKRHSLERLDSMIEAISGKRLTYAGLTA